MFLVCRYTILKMHSKWLLMAKEVIYHCFMGLPQLRGHMCMTHLLRKLLKKNFFTLLNLTFFMKKFPDIYDIQIELEQSKVGQNEMLR